MGGVVGLKQIIVHLLGKDGGFKETIIYLLGRGGVIQTNHYLSVRKGQWDSNSYIHRPLFICKEGTVRLKQIIIYLKRPLVGLKQTIIYLFGKGSDIKADHYLSVMEGQWDSNRQLFIC